MKSRTLTKKKSNQVRKEKQEIHIKGARSNNLKNIELHIPKNKLIVVTGLSGSGKSSLIMDTLYAEGQRRYVESLSSYARQFLVRMKKPDVDFIKGICPAIAIEQKVSTHNPRSTVGSMTEIYDYLRLLYARIGRTISPISGNEVIKHQVSDVVDFIMDQPEGTRVYILAPFSKRYQDRTFSLELSMLLQKGFTRIWHQDKITSIEDQLNMDQEVLRKEVLEIRSDYQILIDRIVVAQNNDDLINRLGDSIQTAFYESEGDCIININNEYYSFNNRFELDGQIFLEPTPQLFNYNNSYGACPQCEGYGRVMGIDEKKVIPNPAKSVYEGAVAAWSGEKSSVWLTRFTRDSNALDFPIHRPYQDLTAAEKKILWHGQDQVQGIYAFFDAVQQQLYKIQNRVLLARYRGRTTCPTCEGGRLRKEATCVKVHGRSLPELVILPIDELQEFFEQVTWTTREKNIAHRILMEIQTRLRTMTKMGLGYLSVDRVASTLSGGESQRINLTRTLGSNLTNSMYILDEPSIGLHPKDTARLVQVLKKLRDLKNTVIVVEHEEEIIRSADHIIEVGPMAGTHGGEIVYSGPYHHFITTPHLSITADYLTGRQSIPLPLQVRKSSHKIHIKGARQYNLKNIDVTIPLQAFTAISGVSGSGKTTLIKHILYPALKRHIGDSYPLAPGIHHALEGDLDMISEIEYINQNPIGKSSRSNPITYVKAYDSIRNLMSKQPLAKIRGFKPGHFSFNTDGGRCDTCKGEGETTVEMQFLADVKLLCEDCKGKRFKQEVLDVVYNGKNIAEILEMSIEEALEFFTKHADIVNKIKPLNDVGLGYVKLGQSSSTLSGGEAQRVKLASYLGTNNRQHILFVFDEPTTGLHFHDIKKLLFALNALVENGHTVVVVEHNLEVIKSADWVIDLGPEGGKGGGHLIYQGEPAGLALVPESYTGQYIATKVEN